MDSKVNNLNKNDLCIIFEQNETLSKLPSVIKGGNIYRLLLTNETKTAVVYRQLIKDDSLKAVIRNRKQIADRRKAIINSSCITHDYLSAGKIKGNIRRWLYKQNKNKKNEDQYQHQHDTDSLNEQQLLLNVAANENILTIDEHELTDRQLEENSDSSENEEEDCFVDNNIISTNTQHREKIRSRAARYIKDIQSLLLSDSLEIYQMNLIGKKKEWDALFIKYFDRSIEKRIKQFGTFKLKHEYAMYKRNISSLVEIDNHGSCQNRQCRSLSHSGTRISSNNETTALKVDSSIISAPTTTQRDRAISSEEKAELLLLHKRVSFSDSTGMLDTLIERFM
ncbi:unnamed protein product [Didymodactylos carnosus]|uniref:Uncharacterized protein n=1 Tax=Didymodactylos carnosus TaxID=1234261 RepID=A0A814NL66_9BILA|nr:unnamed protein product [Didymodactylos carnosus]CAF3860602.1 unnamed protein product [Didymodactylos carnosus]